MTGLQHPAGTTDVAALRNTFRALDQLKNIFGAAVEFFEIQRQNHRRLEMSGPLFAGCIDLGIFFLEIYRQRRQFFDDQAAQRNFILKKVQVHRL